MTLSAWQHCLANGLIDYRKTTSPFFATFQAMLMLHVSDLLLQHREVTTFKDLVEVVKERSYNEMFFRMDLKPPYHDTPDNWEMILEAAFSSRNTHTTTDSSSSE